MNQSADKPGTADEIELAIDTLAFGGKGVARLNGFVIFVEGAVPGDRVRAKITRAKRSYAEARVVALLNPSSERIEAACSHFGVCGGCSWQTLTYGAQLRYKQDQVSECLSHIGGLKDFETEAPMAAQPLWRYRNKVEFSFAPGAARPDGGAPAASPGLGLGFHLPGEWRRVIDIEDCLLHSQATNGIRNAVREFARSSGLAAYDEKDSSGFWRHLVIREGFNTGEIMVNLVTGPGDFPDAGAFAAQISSLFPQVASLVWSVNQTRASVATGFPYTVLAGRDHIFEEICGLRLKVTPSTFLQTNTVMAERLYRRALDYAALNGGEHVLDLYSGIGSISLLLAASAADVHGIEIVEDAVRMAVENAGANGVANCRFTAGKVRSELAGLAGGTPPDVIILDPPRAGASKKEIQRIIGLAAHRIVYVSCNAATMASNASQLSEAGYRLIRTGAVDMFPHTPHIETVSLFERI
ncbi:MAG: 23S rRNA (uracil(1939)-C(5))-methyltransferase RlmD [Thermoleophilia bacterium]